MNQQVIKSCAEPNRDRGKCEVRGSFIDPCWPLSEMTQLSGKGIRRHAFINTITGERSRDIYSAASGEHAKNGIALNFCPWCGTSLKEAHNSPKDV